MKDFGYCVWYLPKKTYSPHDWSLLTDGFPCHITIKKNMSFIDAVKLYHNIVPQSIYFTLSAQVVSQSSGFHALFFDLIPTSDTTLHPLPFWLPDKPHVSFKYSYDTFLECQKEPILQDSIFDRIALVNCSGHYNDWFIIDVK